MGDMLCKANPVACVGVDLGGRGGEAVKSKVQDTLSKPLEDLVNGMLERALDSLVYFMTFWLRTPSASLDEGDPVGAAIVQLQQYMSTITVFFAVLGIVVAAGRMAWMARVEPVKEVAAMFLRVMFVQAAALLSTQILVRAGDAFSPWLVETALGNNMNYSIETLMPFIGGSAGAYVITGGYVVTQGIGAMLIVGIIILIASAMQVLFLLLRDVLLAIILAFLPTLAAASLFKSGAEGFEKALGWIVALTLYKPVAAAIYVLGTLMVTNVAGDQSSPGQQWMGMLLGTLTLILAVLAMPALVKFVAPAAGRGASSAFSGGAALGAAAGVAATGAAVVAVAGTGGAAAPAAAGTGAATGTGASTGAAAGAAAPGAAAAEPAAAAGSAPPGAGTGTGGGAEKSGGATEQPSGNAPAGGGADETPSPGGKSPSGAEGGGSPTTSSGATAQGASGGGDTGSKWQAAQGALSQASENSDDSGAAVEDMTK